MSTQFEPCDARRCFPCFDEPSLKANFEVKLTVDEHLDALSNMPVAKEEKEDGKKTLLFAPSPKMSTYLVCMVVGEYDFVEGKTESDITVRVWGKKGESHLGQFGLDIGIAALNFYEKFFGIKYPLPKMDMIGLMNMAGAMEHWGLVTYRDSALLCDPKTAPLRQRLTILTIITHELGHQWFGNLVTMEWWKELWLNEGFASWVETLCADAIMPEYRAWTDFCRLTLSDGLELDSLLSSHPIEVEILHSRDVDEIFDNISYNKGAGVIRMLASIIGLDAFSKGLSSYLSKFSYANATTLDLWESLSEATHKDIKAIMHPWTSTMGYPVIYVDWDEATKKTTFTQHRFLSSGKPTDEEDSTLWPIHLAVRHKSASSGEISATELVSFDTRSYTTDKFDISQLTWFRANVDQSGFMRVIYSEPLYSKILDGLKLGDFGDIDRWALVCDGFATCLAGLTNVDDLFRLLSMFHAETDNTVLGEISAKLEELEIIFGQKYDVQLRAFRAHLFEQPFKALGLAPKEGEDDHTRAARPIVLQEMASLGNVEVIAECRRLFDLVEKDGDYSVLDSNLWTAVLNTIAQNSTKTDLDKMRALVGKAKDPMAALSTVRSMGFISDPQLLMEALEWALLSDTLPASTAPRIVFGASSTLVGREQAWNMLEKNHEGIAKRFQKGPFLFAMMIESMTVFATKEKADHVEKFFVDHKFSGIERTVKQAVDKIRGRAAIFERSSPALGAWFSANGY